MKKPQCSKCKRALTDPFSIAVGMGPECRGKLSRRGWKFPKPKWRVSHGSVQLIGMTGKIVEPPVGDLTQKYASTTSRRARLSAPHAGTSQREGRKKKADHETEN